MRRSEHETLRPRRPRGSRSRAAILKNKERIARDSKTRRRFQVDLWIRLASRYVVAGQHEVDSTQRAVLFENFRRHSTRAGRANAARQTAFVEFVQ